MRENKLGFSIDVKAEDGCTRGLVENLAGIGPAMCVEAYLPIRAPHLKERPAPRPFDNVSGTGRIVIGWFLCCDFFGGLELTG